MQPLKNAFRNQRLNARDTERRNNPTNAKLRVPQNTSWQTDQGHLKHGTKYRTWKQSFSISWKKSSVAYPAKEQIEFEFPHEKFKNWVQIFPAEN